MTPRNVKRPSLHKTKLCTILAPMLVTTLSNLIRNFFMLGWIFWRWEWL
jgi:hypothetical protein